MLTVRPFGGFPAANTSRNRLTRGSSGKGVRAAGGSERQRPPGYGRPPIELESVVGEQGDDQPIDAKGHAARVRGSAARIVHMPHLAEVIAVIIETHARGRRCVRVVRN